MWTWARLIHPWKSIWQLVQLPTYTLMASSGGTHLSMAFHEKGIDGDTLSPSLLKFYPGIYHWCWGEGISLWTIKGIRVPFTLTCGGIHARLRMWKNFIHSFTSCHVMSCIFCFWSAYRLLLFWWSLLFTLHVSYLKSLCVQLHL